MEENKQTVWSSADRQSAVLLMVIVSLVALLLLSSVILFCTRSVWAEEKETEEENQINGVVDPEGNYPFADGAELNGEDKIALIPFKNDSVVIQKSYMQYSQNAALVDLSIGQVIASGHADARIYPASMTKMMTLVVIVEHIPTEETLDEMLTISQKTHDAMVAAQSSGIGLEAGEQLSMRSLLYALMLKSDNWAAVELATYIAGSEEAFVEMMNQKAAAMGLENTHFVNSTGLHHEDHYSSCRDMASIMAYAMKMSLCRTIMTTEHYTAQAIASSGKQFTYEVYHDLLVTKFNKYGAHRAQPDNVTVLAGKSGWTGKDSGYCLATYAEDAEGKAYVCVTAKGEDPEKVLGSLVCIPDYLSIYNNYVP